MKREREGDEEALEGNGDEGVALWNYGFIWTA